MKLMSKLVVSLAIASYFLTSCNTPGTIGSEILPNQDKFYVSFSDTSVFDASQETDDSLVTSWQTNYLLGTLNDPVFGKSYAGIFAQLQIPLLSVDFGEGRQLDSAVLILNYKGQYGDADALQNLLVYQLSESMNLDIENRSNDKFMFNPIEIGKINNLKTPDKDTTIAIPINYSFGNWLLNQTADGNYSSTAAFMSAMKGIYIAPDTSSGFSNNMMTVDLSATLSGLKLYFHNQSSDSLSYTFFINVVSSKSNLLTHQYSGTKIASVLQTGNPSDTLYLQGAAGLRIRLKMPDLSKLGHIAINKAQIVATVLTDNDSTYAKPSKIVPRVVVDSTNGFASISDESLGLIFTTYDIGGDIQQQSINGEDVYQYVINLSKHLYQVQNGMLDTNDIVLKINKSSSYPGRVMIAGPHYPDPAKRLHLNIIYTKFK